MGNKIFWLTGVVPRPLSPTLCFLVCLLWQYSDILILFLIYRFDGRALLDFIRDSSSRHFRAPEKTEEEEELEECVNFERYRDLIKHRRRGCRYFFIFDHVLNSWRFFSLQISYLYLCVYSTVFPSCYDMAIRDNFH